MINTYYNMHVSKLRIITKETLNFYLSILSVRHNFITFHFRLRATMRIKNKKWIKNNVYRTYNLNLVPRASCLFGGRPPSLYQNVKKPWEQGWYNLYVVK